MNYQGAHIDSQFILTASKVFRETVKSQNIPDLRDTVTPLRRPP